MTETPPHVEALAAFRRFIEGEGLSPELIWVFREDVINRDRDCWVRAPVPAGNESLARGYFEYGREQGLGVTLEVICRVGGRTACFVWVPGNCEIAEYALQGPLKLRVPTNPVEASAILSGISWGQLRWRQRWRRYPQLADVLPRRAEVERLTGRRI